MNNLFLGFTVFGVLIFVWAWALNLFDFSFMESSLSDFSFTESRQEPRCMGGQVPDVGYGAKERVADNPYVIATKKATTYIKKKIRKRRNPEIQDI